MGGAEGGGQARPEDSWGLGSSRCWSQLVDLSRHWERKAKTKKKKKTKADSVWMQHEEILKEPRHSVNIEPSVMPFHHPGSLGSFSFFFFEWCAVM